MRRCYLVSPIMLQLHWSKSESENDIAWNGYLHSPVVCLHWSESDFTWKLGYNPFWSDVASNISPLLLLQFNCTLTGRHSTKVNIMPLKYWSVKGVIRYVFINRQQIDLCIPLTCKSIWHVKHQLESNPFLHLPIIVLRQIPHGL